MISKTNFRCWNKSTWALVALTISIIFSVIVNQDIMVDGYKPIMKSKYFIIGIFSIAPFTYFFKSSFADEKKIKFLLSAFCLATAIATIVGFINIYFGFNIPHWKVLNLSRNPGTFGMVLNYAHNMAYATIILYGLVVYRKSINNYISSTFLLSIFLISLWGIYTSYTRGAWIGLLAGIPFFYFKQNKKLFVVAVSVIALAGTIAYFTAGRAMYREDKDVSRLGQWYGAVAAFKERPVLGVGYLNFEKVCSEIKYRHNLPAPEFLGHAHNNFFEILADTGALGFISYILWLGFWFYEMYQRNDIVGKIGLPFIVTFIAGGLTQSTISLGINLFFVMAVYALTQVNFKIIKAE
ncbi:MAG: O-antigen ligase family protein [Bacteriovorax sp.]